MRLSWQLPPPAGKITSLPHTGPVTELTIETDPAELGPFLDSNLVGTPETICRRIDTLVSLGFNYFMVSCATPGTPLAVRQRMMIRFAEDVCPRYSRAMRKGRAA